jgi:hypothetical protein
MVGEGAEPLVRGASTVARLNFSMNIVSSPHIIHRLAHLPYRAGLFSASTPCTNDLLSTFYSTQVSFSSMRLWETGWAAHSMQGQIGIPKIRFQGFILHTFEHISRHMIIFCFLSI